MVPILILAAGASTRMRGRDKLLELVAGEPLLARVARAVDLKADQIIAAQLLDNGTPWMGLLLDDPSTVLQLTPDFPRLTELGQKVGVVAMHTTAAADQDTPGAEVRAFAPHMGINEDPATGSFNASLAQWLIAEGHAPESYVAAQGTCLDRAGRVYVQRDAGGQVWIGGHSVSCISGSVTL